MKPTRGLSESWRNNLPRERRVALVSLAVLLVLLGSMVLYQRYWGSNRAPIDTEDPPAEVKANQELEPEAGEPAKDVTAPGDAAAAKVGPPALTPPPRLTPPLVGAHKVLQPFGWVESQAFSDYRQHVGLDYSAMLGESVLAAGPGRVVLVESDPLNGNVVEVDHGSGLVTRYAGLNKVLVTVNAPVQAGNIIGQAGGLMTAEKQLGPHLHFEVRLNGEPVDPQIHFQR